MQGGCWSLAGIGNTFPGAAGKSWSTHTPTQTRHVQGKPATPRLFVLGHLYNPVLALFKNGFQLAPGAELSPTQKNKSEGISESQNFRVLDYWIQGPTEAENRQSPSRPPLPALPGGWGWHCLIILYLLFPPPQMNAPPTFFNFQIGVNSFSPFKTLLGGGDHLPPLAKPPPQSLPDPDPAHTPA